MKEKEFYTIGEVSKICNISKKALRFYDQIGIISPDKVQEENNYRYYSKKTLLSIPVVKYYKQMGFKLDEMREVLDGDSYQTVERQFRKKIDELDEQLSLIRNSYISVKDWYNLVLEARMVLENGSNEVAIKYVEPEEYVYMAQDFSYNYMESIINIDWTNYLEGIGNEITGAVILSFPSFMEKMEGRASRCRIMQRPILKYKPEQVVTLGGYMAATCYHIGSLETIGKTYRKIYNWIREHGYELETNCYERYVTDYWTLRKPEQFVTEVVVEVRRK